MFVFTYKSGHRKFYAQCPVGREFFSPRIEWAGKIFSVKSHLTPVINNDWSLIIIITTLSISEDIFFLFVYRIKMYEGGTLAADTGDIFDKTHQGGRIGAYAFSQEQTIFSALKYSCKGTFIIFVYYQILIINRVIPYS